MEIKSAPTPWLPTYTGRVVSILDPTPDMVDIHDIAHALSMTCRFGGHCRDFYSVAEHSMLVLNLAQNQVANDPSSYQIMWKDFQAILLHDAAEAYVGDLISPIKREMPDYVELEKKWLSAIDDRFNLEGALSDPSPLLKSITKASDTSALAIEVVNLYPNPDPGWWERFPPPSSLVLACFPVEALPPAVARLRFLQQFFNLGGKRGCKAPWSSTWKKPSPPNDYAMGSGTYLEVSTQRTFTLSGRTGSSTYGTYDDAPEDKLSFNVSWLGQEIREGRVIPVKS